jgi:hypothetical protein
LRASAQAQKAAAHQDRRRANQSEAPRLTTKAWRRK